MLIVGEKSMRSFVNGIVGRDFRPLDITRDELLSGRQQERIAEGDPDTKLVWMLSQDIRERLDGSREVAKLKMHVADAVSCLPAIVGGIAGSFDQLEAFGKAL